jgi:hypothetical protein
MSHLVTQGQEAPHSSSLPRVMPSPTTHSPQVTNSSPLPPPSPRTASSEGSSAPLALAVSSGTGGGISGISGGGGVGVGASCSSDAVAAAIERGDDNVSIRVVVRKRPLTQGERNKGEALGGGGWGGGPVWTASLSW